jgi:hypothetical protein
MGGDANLTAVEAGARGGRARAERLTPGCRGGIARRAAETRWGKAPAPAPGGKAPGRLPHGSEFAVGYDAAGPAWSGTLTVPHGGDGRLAFMASCPDVVQLLCALAGLYREWIALHEGGLT